METVEISTTSAEFSTVDGPGTVVVVGGQPGTTLVVTPAASPALVVTGDASIVVVGEGSGSGSSGGPGIDLSAAQDGDVLEVQAGALVPTHQQRNQIYDGGNF
jgi:hypothetical protein